MSEDKAIRLEVPEEIHSGPLVLRAWRPDDVPAFHAAVIENIDHLRPWMPWIAEEPSPIERRYELVERWAGLIAARTDWPCAILLDGAVAGSAGIHQRRAPGSLEIGYWVHQAHTGRGVATLTSYLLTDLAFQAPGTEAVEIYHDRANWVSRRVPRRLGYDLVAETPATSVVAGSPGEEGIDCLWRVTRAQWSQRRPQEESLSVRGKGSSG
ncbi:MAG: GNAT family N-acetyltransferase [Acidimicrobiales bacterium]